MADNDEYVAIEVNDQAAAMIYGLLRCSTKTPLEGICLLASVLRKIHTEGLKGMPDQLFAELVVTALICPTTPTWPDAAAASTRPQ